MTQADFIKRLSIGVARDDLAPLYPDFINEALHEIQRRRSWRFMLQIGTFTIPVGQTSVNLPANFKELSNTRTPVHLIGTSFQPGLPNVLTPCDVWTRERVLRREQMAFGYSILTPNIYYLRTSIPVYVDWQAETPSLRVFYPATTALMFDVKYFAYLPDLVLSTDSNALTTEYPEMCIAKIKATAFEAINDPAALDQEALFATRFNDAKANDSYAAIAGMELRM